jgi:hypothetical protein
MKKTIIILFVLLITGSPAMSQVQINTKTITREEYRDKTLAMLIGMCGGFLTGYEYLSVHNTPDGYWAPGAVLKQPKEPLLALPDDWFVWLGGTCGGSNRDEHHYGSWLCPNGDMNSDDDSHIDIFNQYLLNIYGPSIAYEDIKYRWMYHRVSDFGGGEGAIQVMRDKDLIAPQCGQRDHGNSGHWLPESYIEAETMGAAFPGMPFRAAALTERFQTITGEGENVEWGKFWAATHAIAYFETDAREVIRKALGVMPANSRIREVFDITKELYEKYPGDWRRAVREFWHMPMSNPMSVGFDGIQMLSDVNNGTGLLSIWYGENDYVKTLKIVALAGGDGDCTASSVCGIFGILKGMAGTPAQFKDVLYRNGQGRWINDVVNAFSIRYDYPLSFTYDELASMYQKNAETMIRTYGGKVTNTLYTIPAESGQIPQIPTRNWGFEDGTLNGWETWRSGEVDIWNECQCPNNDASPTNPLGCNAATGKRKGTLMTKNNQSEGKLFQRVTGLKPGATYKITGRIHTDGGREARFYVDKYGGPYKYASMKNGNNPFRYIYHYVTMGENSTSLEVGLHGPPTTNDSKWCNIDDIIISEVLNPGKATRYEAENAIVNHSDINSNPSASGGKYVGGIFKDDSYVEFDNLEADYTGEYILRLNFANAGQYAQMKVEVNGRFIGYVELNETGNWGVFSANETDVHVKLNKGKNTVRFSYYRNVAEIDYIDMISPYGSEGKPADDAEIIDKGIYKIISRNSNKVLDIDGPLANGANVIQKTFTGASSQYFKLTKINGYYTITPVQSNLAVEVGGWKTGNGDNVNLYTNNRAGCQLWGLFETDNGYYRIINQNSGLALDVEGVSVADGANVFQWEYLGGANQQWKLEFVGMNETDLPAAVPGIIRAEAFKSQHGIITKANPEAGGGNIVANIDNGDWMEYYISVNKEASYRFHFRYTSATQGGTITILSNNTRLGSIKLESTGGWNNWKTSPVDVVLPEGTQTLKLEFEGGSGLFDLNWINIEYATDCSGEINGNAKVDDCGICSGGNTGIEPCSVLNIHLVKGWNLVSINLQPEDNSIRNLFSGLDVGMVKNMDTFWKTGQPEAFNRLQHMVPGEGYLVLMQTEGILTITGTPLSFPDPVPEIRIGWNLAGCPYPAPVSFESMFDVGECEKIEAFEGVWSPYGEDNTLSGFEPGKGYFIKLVDK